jgi:uncharacterized protein (TIGR00255 family)
MTGYGEAITQARHFVLAVEIKSVNNRFLKISAKVPEEVSYVQNPIEDRVRRSLPRGSVNVSVRFEPSTNADLYEIDEGVLKKYVETVRRLASELGTKEDLRIKDLLLLPGVVHTETALLLGKEEVLPAALETVDRALAEVGRMRATEGAAMEAEFRDRLKAIRRLLDQVREVHPRALQEHHSRLRERIDGLLKGSDASLSGPDLLREIAIVAERADIAEEISRLDSHVSQFLEALGSVEPVGRKLEFIVQEMFRECNTMASKSTSNELNEHVVDMKTEVTRLKEQVLNVE